MTKSVMPELTTREIEVLQCIACVPSGGTVFVWDNDRIAASRLVDLGLAEMRTGEDDGVPSRPRDEFRLTAAGLELAALHKETADLIATRGGEHIDHAAFLIRGVVCSVYRPLRHPDLLHWCHAVGIPRTTTKEQGFVTSTGRFVGRKEALAIATAAGQMKGPRISGDEILTSEDLW